MGFMNKCGHGRARACRDLRDSCYDLGKRLQPAACGRNMTACVTSSSTCVSAASTASRISARRLSLQRYVGYRKYETGLLRRDGKPGFNTSTGRVELWSYAFQRFGEDPLPYYEEPQYSPRAHARASRAVSVRADDGCSSVRILPLREPSDCVLSRTQPRSAD